MKKRLLHLVISGLLACLAGGCSVRPVGNAIPNYQVMRMPYLLSQPQVRISSQQPLGQNYYAPVQGQKGQELLKTLNRIVVKHRDLGYDQARDIMFGSVDDLDNDDVVEGVYIGRQLNHVNNRRSAYRDGRGFNAEHTWPQSKGASGTAKADLHHLFPADINANGKRSSYPFGEVIRPVWQEGGSQLGYDTQGAMVFEPRQQHKGNVARAILYFYTTYGLQGGLDLSNFRQEEAILKHWHEQDPVDQNERARNDMVFENQGNRNPYIDHPEFVPAVGQFQ